MPDNRQIIEFTISATTFALMFGVGLDCTPTGIRAGFSRGRLVAVVTLLQFSLIPGIALGVSSALSLAPSTAGALLLFTSCPSGTVSNSFTFISRGNTSLSVILTIFSCLTATLLTPFSITLWSKAFGAVTGETLHIPFHALLNQLIPLMAVPTSLGALVRNLAPDFTTRHMRTARITSIILIISMISLITCLNPSGVFRGLVELLPTAALLTSGLLALGLAVAKAFRLPARERTTVMFELPCRNLGIAALLGFTVLKRPDLVSLTTGFFIVEAAILTTTALVIARTTPKHP